MFCPVCHSLPTENRAVTRVIDGVQAVHQIAWCSRCDTRFDQRVSQVNTSRDEESQAGVNEHFYRASFAPSEFTERLEINRNMIAGMVVRARLRDVFVEIGIGLGFLARAAGSSFDQVYGIDLEVETATSVGPIPPNVSFQVHKTFLDTYAGPISALCAWHVCEHLPAPHTVLEPLFKRMPTDALFFGQVPAYRDEYVFDAHYVFYSEMSLIHLTRAYGFHPIYLERDEANGFVSFCFRKG